MLSSTRRPVLAASLVLALGSAACSSTNARPPAFADPVVSGRVALPPPGPPPGHLVRAEVDRVLVTQGPPWVLRRVVSEEVMRADGKFSGWRLVGLPEEWRDIDLKPGDVVTRVNGLPLETPDEAWEAWKSVGRSSELKITLMRDGAARQAIVPIDGAPTDETTKALGRDPGPQRPVAPAQGRSISLGGGSTAEPAADEESY
jgi:S1-C subfamily serine protease